MEQDSEEGGGSGDEEADIPAHHHPQGLEDLQNKATVNMSSTGKPHVPLRHRAINMSVIYDLQLF